VCGLAFFGRWFLRAAIVTTLSSTHLPLPPCTDVALALGIIPVIIKENLYYKEFVE
jgi:anaerobic selenocysteine-containing dehydrogenase